ncbi:MAG TPA: glycosyltransferase family 4 protein, partial [Anaerolineaceae bacterium]
QLGMLRSPFGRINPILRIANLMRARQLAQAVAREIEAGGYDLAFVQPCQVEFAPSVLRYIQSIPTVYYCHEPPRAFYEEMPARPYDRQERSYRKLLNRLDPLPGLYQRTLLANDRENIHCAGQVLVNSRYMAGVFAQTYHRQARVRYMGIDTQKFHPLGLPSEHFFLSVGSLTRLKGFDFLVRALGQLDPPDRYPLTIVSNFQVAEERTYLEGLAREQGVALTLLDGVTDERLVDLYNRATLTLYSPVREPFGLVPVESMACATPVVTISEGGVAESVLPGQTGLFVERDPRQFAAAIKQLVVTPTLRAEFGASGRRHALAKWSWDVVMPEIEKTLMDACSTNEPRDTMKTIDQSMEET